MSRGIHARIIGVMLLFLVAMVSVTSSGGAGLCNTPAEDALYTTGEACLDTQSFRFQDMFLLSSWQKLCSVTNATENCLRKQFQSCSTQYIQDVLFAAMTHLYNYVNTWIPSVDSLIQIINRGCQGSATRDSLTYAYKQAKHLDCVNEKTRSDVTDCVNVLLDETAHFRLSGNTSYVTSPDRRQSLIRFATSTFQCVRNLVRANCSHWAQDVLVGLVNETLPLQIRGTLSKDKVNVPLTKTSILSTQRSTVGAYGGVHLVIYGLNAPITCAISGHVIYLSNQLFTISGFNQAAEKTGRTYINKLEIEFFRTGGGVIGTYQTNGNMLAETFLYGDKELSPYYNPIQIMTADSQSTIHINSSSLGYIITIQKQRKGYLFSVRISDEVLATSSGTLVSGCSYSKGQVVDVTPGSLAGDTLCHDTCQDVQVTEEDLVLDLRQACLYDCISDADTDSSRAFLDDVTEARGYDGMLELVDPPTTPGQSSSAGSWNCLGWGSVMIMLLLCRQIVLD